MPLDLPGRDLLAWQLRNVYELATRQVEIQIRDNLQRAGVNDIRPAHFRVFEFLPGAGLRLTDLARQAHVTKQSMGHLVDDLEQMGYVERVADPTDGRANIIQRTERGWEVERIAMRAISIQDSEWRNTLGDEWYSTLFEGLNSLRLVMQDSVGEP